jgi:cell wall assembly regulator SMI1
MQSITQLLDDYIAYFTEFAPQQLQRCTPAIRDELDAFEASIGLTLPSSYRELMTCAPYLLEFTCGFGLRSLAQTMEDRARMNRLLEEGAFDDGRIAHHKKNGFGNWDGGVIQEVWWHPLWIPFASDGCGNMKCIDLAPGEHGRAGQIVAMEIQDGQGPFIEPEHESFEDYLLKNLQYLREGRVMLDPDGDGYYLTIDHYEPPNPGIWDETR